MPQDIFKFVHMKVLISVILSMYCLKLKREVNGRCSLATVLSTAADAAYMHVSVFKLSCEANDVNFETAWLKYRH